MGKKGAKRKTRWRTLSIGTPPGEEDEEDGSQRNGYVKSEHRSPTHYNKDSTQRNGYHNSNSNHQQHNNHHHHSHHNSNHQQQPWLKSRHGSAGSSSNGGSSSGYASGESRNVAFNEDEYTKITTPRQDMLFKKGYLSQRKQLYASTSATPSTTESQSASHSTAGRDGSEAAEDQQLLDGVTATDYLPGGGGTATVLEAAPMSYGTYYDHASGYYYEYPMMLVGPALPPDQMHHVPCAAVQCAPVPLRPIEWVNPAFVPKLASQQYCYMDYQTQGPDCAALVDAQGMPLSAELPLTNGLSNETSLTGSASVSASGSVADDVDESCNNLPIVDQEMTEVAVAVQQQQQQQVVIPTATTAAVLPLEVVDQPDVVALPMEYAPVEATPYVEPQPMPYLYPGQYMFGPPVVNVNGVTIQSGPMLRCSDMLASSAAAAAAAAAAKRRKKKKKKKQKRPHALGNTEDDDEEDYSSEGDMAVSSPSRVPWPPTESSTTPVVVAAAMTTTTSWPLNPECQEFHLPEANASMESCEPQPQPQLQQQQLSNEDKRLNNDDDDDDDEEEEEKEEVEEERKVAEEKCEKVVLEEECIKPKTRRRSLKIVREATPGPDLCDITTEERREDEEEEDDNEIEDDDDDRPIEQVTTMLATASIIETTPRKDGDVDASGWQNERSSITSESCCAASRTADETDSGFESQSTGAPTTTTAPAPEGSSSSKSSRPITDAVNEWLKRANSPDLFITSSATSDDDDNNDEQRENEVDDDDDGKNQSKNLQGNPMPALSVNGQASHGQLASSNAQQQQQQQNSCKHRKKKLRRKRDQSEQCGKQDLAQETPSISVQASEDSSAAAAGVVASEMTVKDSDAGMRVAEKTRIPQHHDDTTSMQPVKTYEKGEIVVSMDGELLLVETVTTRRNSNSSTHSSGSASVQASLGSIEEPDLVLECWEPETVEPIVTPKKILDDDSASMMDEEKEDKRENMGHVQRYYRLIEDEVNTEPAKIVPNSSDEESMSSSDDEIVEVVVPVITPDKCISYDPRLPVDEAFEVYESCYNASSKSLPFEHTTSPFYHGDPTEGPIHCKANCCNIQ